MIYSCGGGGGGGGSSVVPTPQQVSITGLATSLPLTSQQMSNAISQQTESPIPISNAAVTITDYCDGKSFNLATDNNGKFSVPNLTICDKGSQPVIEVKVEKEGYALFSKSFTYNDLKNSKDVTLPAYLDPIKNATTINSDQINLSSQGNDDYVSIAVVRDKSTLKTQILSGQELTTQLRKSSNLEVVWQLDVKRSLLKAQATNGTPTYIAKINNYDPTNPDDMKKFPTDQSDKGKLVTAGFDFVDIRDTSGKPLTLQKANTQSLSGQALPPNWKIKRTVNCSLIKCDEDKTKDGYQIGFYAYLNGQWKFVGYGTVYDGQDNIVSDPTNASSCQIVLTDSDIGQNLDMNNYYNFDHVLAGCGQLQTGTIRVNLKDDAGNPVSSWVGIVVDGNYQWGDTNSDITYSYLSSSSKPNIQVLDPYTYKWINPSTSTSTSIQCSKDSTNTNIDTYNCTVTNPYKCSVTGTLKDSKNNPLPNKLVYSNIAKTSTYTDSSGKFKLQTLCNVEGYIYVGHRWTSMATFNVNRTTNNDETSDDGTNVVLKDISIQNNPPEISYIYAGGSYSNVLTVKSGSNLNLYSFAYDPDGDKVTYSWSDNNCGGKFSDATSPNPTWTAPTTPPSTGKCTITLTVSDGSATTTKDITITVTNNNIPPVISYMTASQTQVKKGGSVNLYSFAYDPDGANVTYSWSDNCGGKFTDATLQNDGTTLQNPTWTAPTTAKTCTITLTVSDGSATTTKDITINVGYPPVISSVNIPTTANIGDKLTFSVVASDADGDSLTYEWRVNNSVVCTTSTCSYTVNAGGSYFVEVTVKDSDGNTAKASGTVMVGKNADTTINIQKKN
ncbi:MAG: PKD domain-containing protein [Hydrogenothermaceae bacterium]|nr:PKD domain-containing protein [Hydrogenothermaceae bacterium]